MADQEKLNVDSIIGRLLEGWYFVIPIFTFKLKLV